MTAEVAIANKLGVALAADSIVTIASRKGEKTYNTSNKLFTLSKYHPVGILIYGGTAINGIPVEIIIKEFRHSIGQKQCNTLADYGYLFYRFLHESVPIKRSDQASNFARITDSCCTILYNEIASLCVSRRISFAMPQDRIKILDAVRDCTQRLAERAKSAGRCFSLGRITARTLANSYPKVIEKRVNRIFDRLKLPTASSKAIAVAVYSAITSNLFSDSSTGFVIAGYGKNDYYPSIDAFETDGFFADRLKLIASGEQKVTAENEAMIYPFAQSDASELFMEGVDRLYQGYIDETVRDLLSGLADATASHFGIKNRKVIETARQALAKLAEEFTNNLTQKRFDLFVRRALEAVEFLDKNELAVLAESLVSLTALRQKVSLDIETVGGPIDVAVISKGDGFIWVKRKHYFSPDLNPFFMQKYLDLAIKQPK